MPNSVPNNANNNGKYSIHLISALLQICNILVTLEQTVLSLLLYLMPVAQAQSQLLTNQQIHRLISEAIKETHKLHTAMTMLLKNLHESGVDGHDIDD